LTQLLQIETKRAEEYLVRQWCFGKNVASIVENITLYVVYVVFNEKCVCICFLWCLKTENMALT